MSVTEEALITISWDERYHVKGDKPLYDVRYEKVMSFHDDIAPVFDGKKSFFINVKNQRLFNRTFLDAYGFYERAAAVKDDRGWFHISNNGTDLYTERFSWVGNYQEGRCPVVNFKSRYFHITSNGQKAYESDYSYVGDYKYGIAVVVNDLLLSTHIDLNGDYIHGRSFKELDVFHKGYAVAKDENGYFHISKLGEELYSHRFLKLEPFYNGKSFATSLDNKKGIVSQDGAFQLLERRKKLKC